MTAARLGLYGAMPAALRPDTDAAKATMLRTLLRDGPTPAAAFRGPRLATLRALLAQRLASYVAGAPESVRATGSGRLWLERVAAGRRARKRPPYSAAERADPALAEVVRYACADWQDRRSLATRALDARAGKPAQALRKADGPSDSVAGAARFPCPPAASCAR